MIHASLHLMAEFISLFTCSPRFKWDVAFYIRLQLPVCRIAREEIAEMSPHSSELNWLNDDKHSPCQINRLTGIRVLTYTLWSSLGAANASVRLSKLARHQNLLWYRKWVRVAVHQIINPHHHIMWQTFFFFLTSKDVYAWGMKDHVFFRFLLTAALTTAFKVMGRCPSYYK